MSDASLPPSEYLKYLPALFRETAVDGSGSDGVLPGLLRAFEKILTGVKKADGNEDQQVRITSEGPGAARSYEPLETVIDELDRYFDPFRTDPRFLDWLASWVALEPEPDWTPAEKRKMIARMVQMSRRVGLKPGLYDMLDIYARESLRPRVSIDDDEALFRVTLGGADPPKVSVVAFAQVVESITLRLMPSLADAKEIPLAGRGLLIVARLKDKLRFRYFDLAGKQVLDKAEADIAGKNSEIRDLNDILRNLWTASFLTQVNKYKIVSAVQSIVGELAGSRLLPVLYRPAAIAVMADADPEKVRYIVADAGLPGAFYPPPLQPSLWVVKPDGELDDVHWLLRDEKALPMPRPINREVVSRDQVQKDPGTQYQLIEPVAVAVEVRNKILVLERGHAYEDDKIDPGVFRYAWTDLAQPNAELKFERKRLLTLEKSEPIDMVLFREGATSKLAILVKELKVVNNQKQYGSFQVWVVNVDDPGKIEMIDLGDPKNDNRAPVTPTAIAYESTGNWIIADARDDDRGLPGTLIRVEKTSGPPKLTDLLPPDSASNPLVYPAGVVVLASGDYVVSDRGVKVLLYKEKSFCRRLAEPANVFRVKLGAGPPTLIPLARRGQLSWPTRAAIDPTSGDILVADQGESDSRLLAPALKTNQVNLTWRGKPSRFGVSVLFSKQRLDDLIFETPARPSEEQLARKREESEILYSANRGIQSVIDEYKPIYAIQLWKPY
jgi:phage tail-like protein